MKPTTKAQSNLPKVENNDMFDSDILAGLSNFQVVLVVIGGILGLLLIIAVAG